MRVTPAVQEPVEGQRSVLPTVLVTLDEEVAPLSGEVVLELAHRHPDALSFFAAVRMTGEESPERRHRRLRVAFESVTELRARQKALREGLFIEDKLRVFIAFSAGWRPRAVARRVPHRGSLERVIEAVHRVGADFFDQTAVEVNTLVFLPDLAAPWDRDWRYAEAYQRLREIDQAGDASRALAHRTSSSLDFRWFVDCRTRAGAHAGGWGEVLRPVARMLSVLLDGRPGGPAAAALEAQDQLRARVRDRQSAYSTFGVGTLFHYPPGVVRSLAARAAHRYLVGYGGIPLDGDERDDLPPEVTRGAPPDLSLLLVEWGEQIRNSFNAAVKPEYRTARRLDPELRRRQVQHRAMELAGVAELLERELREVLARGGLPLARQVIRALGLTKVEDEDLLRVPPGVALGDLRDSYRVLVRECLGTASADHTVDALRAERARLEREGGSAAAERIDQIDRELLAASASRRRLETLTDVDVDPDQLETQLERVEQEAHRELAADAGLPPLHPPRGGWLRRILGGLLGGKRRRPDSDFGPMVPPPAAWHIAETLRWLRGYEELLARLGEALAAHESDVRNAAAYYNDVHHDLKRWLTTESGFSISMLEPSDFACYAETYLGRIAERLVAEWDWRRMARCFTVPAVTLEPFQSALVTRLAGFDPALHQVAQAACGPLLTETIASALEERASGRAGQQGNELKGLAEAAQPLLRPRAAGEQEPETLRWLFAPVRAHEVLRADPRAAAFLDADEMVAAADGNPYEVTLCSTVHGFPAHALRKTFRFRSDFVTAGEALPENEDPIPFQVALEDESSRLFNLVVLAKALKVLGPDGNRLKHGHVSLPADLLLATDHLAFLMDNRLVASELRVEVERALQSEAGVELLRRQAERGDLTEVEREVVLDTLTELSRPAFAWDIPIYGNGGAHAGS